MYTHLNFAGGGTVAPQKLGQSLHATAATHGMIQNLLKTVARLATISGPFGSGHHLDKSFHKLGKV